jgi:hypothetical protein
MPTPEILESTSKVSQIRASGDGANAGWAPKLQSIIVQDEIFETNILAYCMILALR